jgi:hypothetical protein
VSGHGEKLTRKQEQAIAALQAEPTVAAARTNLGRAESIVSNPLLRAGVRVREVFRSAEPMPGRSTKAEFEARLAFVAGLLAADPQPRKAAVKAAVRQRFGPLSARTIEGYIALARERHGEAPYFVALEARKALRQVRPLPTEG